MAFGIVHKFPGGTKEQYEATLRAVHTDQKLPAGQVLHCAGQVSDGWLVFAVHESKASWEAFRDTTLVPALQAGIEGGVTTPPEEIEIDLHTVRMTPELSDVAD